MKIKIFGNTLETTNNGMGLTLSLPQVLGGKSSVISGSPSLLTEDLGPWVDQLILIKKLAFKDEDDICLTRFRRKSSQFL